MTEKTTCAASFCTLFLIAGIFPVTLAACAGGEKKQPQTIDDAQPNAGRTAQQASATVEIPENAGTIYFAGGCFWGMEKLFQTIHGVIDAESGYANGREDIVPDYNTVCSGGTGYRETVKVIYDPGRVSLEQLLTAFFHVIDPTVEDRQGNDIGDQYQTGIYYQDEASGETVRAFADAEKKKHTEFAVEIGPLTSYYPAEEYHQDYLDKNPYGYCHISPREFAEINKLIGTEREDTAAPAARYEKPDDAELRRRLTELQYNVTQNADTEYPFSGEYWNFYEEGIYVDIVTGEPLFTSLDKYESSCGWPSFSAPISENNVAFSTDTSHGMTRTEVKSAAGESHLGHVFYNDPESPNGVRYCINSAALEFIPVGEMESRGYGEWLHLFGENNRRNLPGKKE